MSLHVTRLIPKPLAAGFARCLRMIDALGQVRRERTDALQAEARADVAGAARTYGRLVRAMGLILLLETRLRALIEAVASGAIQRPAQAPAAAAGEASVASPVRARSDDLEDDEPRIDIEREERPERPERERFPGFDLGKPVVADPRPLTDIVAAICRDLGLDAEATRRAQAPFAELEALIAGAPPPGLDRPHWDRASPDALLLGEGASLEVRGPSQPP